VSGEFWWGDAPRVVVPTAIYPEMTCGVPAARAFGALAKRADNRSGLVDSTFEQIAQDAGMSRSQAAAGVAKLIELGWVEQLRKGNSRISSKYRVRCAAAAADRPEIQTVKGPDSRTVDRPETRTVEPVGPSGIPDLVVRKSGPPLVSPSSSPTTSLADGEDTAAERNDHDLLPGLMVVAPEPKTAPRAKGGRRGYTAEFEAFWAAYPVRRSNGSKGSKFEASKAFPTALELVDGSAAKAGLAPAELLMAAVKAYAASCGDFPPDAVRWLTGRRWEEHEDTISRTQAGELTDAEINDILGPDLDPLPPLAPGVQPGSPEATVQRARDRAERRAQRLAEARSRQSHRRSA
jgi:hypothetical protein